MGMLSNMDGELIQDVFMRKDSLHRIWCKRTLTLMDYYLIVSNDSKIESKIDLRVVTIKSFDDEDVIEATKITRINSPFGFEIVEKKGNHIRFWIFTSESENIALLWTLKLQNINNNSCKLQIKHIENKLNNNIHTTPHEVQSNSPSTRRGASSNYLSLKGKATPGDRGDNPVADLREAKGEVNRRAVCKTKEGGDGMKSSTGPQVVPVADLREAEGQLNKEGHHGEWKTSGGTTSGKTTSGGGDHVFPTYAPYTNINHPTEYCGVMENLNDAIFPLHSQRLEIPLNFREVSESLKKIKEDSSLLYEKCFNKKEDDYKEPLSAGRYSLPNVEQNKTSIISNDNTPTPNLQVPHNLPEFKYTPEISSPKTIHEFFQHKENNNI